MRAFLPILLALFVAGCSLMANADEARDAVTEFHQRFDAGQFSQIYADAHPEFQATTSEAQLVAQLEALRQNVGAYRGSEETNWSARSGTGGSTVDLEYSATYANATMQEQFRFLYQGDEPLLVGFNLQIDGASGSEN